jgi:hypothetical protein
VNLKIICCLAMMLVALQAGKAFSADSTAAFSSASIDTANFIDNEFVASKASTWMDLHDPATNNLVTRVMEAANRSQWARMRLVNLKIICCLAMMLVALQAPN